MSKDAKYELTDEGVLVATDLVVGATSSGVDIFDEVAFYEFIKTHGVQHPVALALGLSADAMFLLASFPVINLRKLGINSMEEYNVFIELEKAFLS